LIAYFLSNISAKYYENPTMLSRVLDQGLRYRLSRMFFETQCITAVSQFSRYLAVTLL